MAVDRIQLTRPFGASALRVNGQRVRLSDSTKLRNHSPTGFAWGYGGSGPSQTALAILLAVTGDPALAQRHYMSFKFEKVAAWPQDQDIDIEFDVAAWVAAREEARRTCR